MSEQATTAALLPWSRVVTQSFRDGNWEIYASADDGSGATRLTTNPSADTYPDLNRGATRVAYAAREGDYEIRSVATDGSNNIALTANQADDVYPDWSPDGTKIAFQSYRDGQAEIYVMSANGSNQTRLTTSDAYDGEPAWSPDGSRIAFVSNRTGQYYLWVMAADGSGQTQLSDLPDAAEPAWSPDGTQIALLAETNRDGWPEVWRITDEGTSPHRVSWTTDDVNYLIDSWSPDGRYLAYTMVSLIYYEGAWYWTSAKIVIHDIVDIAAPTTSLPSKLDWYFDWQTTDVTPPKASLVSLPPVSPAAIRVRWTGTDIGQSGLRAYDVQVKQGAGSVWEDWLTQTISTTATYPGVAGQYYGFRVRARDGAWNVQAWLDAPGTSTTVETLPPQSDITVQRRYARDTVAVSWSGTDPGGSGISAYDIQMRTGTEGTWTDWFTATTATSATYTGVPGLTTYFRSRATDYATNVEAWHSDNDAVVSFYTWQTTGRIHDNTGTPVSGPTVEMQPPSVGVITGPGTYTAYGLASSPEYGIAWSKGGYGSVPTTTIRTDQLVQLDVALSPVDDVIRDGQFESSEVEPPSWAFLGTLPAGITGTLRHTGQSAALLGEFQAPAWGSMEEVALPKLGTENKVGYPRLAVGGDGTAHVVWTGGEDDNTITHIWYASRSPGGTWTAPFPLSGAGEGQDPTIAADTTGGVYAIWSGYTVDSGYGTYFATKTASQPWSQPERIAPRANNGIDMVVDSYGTVHLLLSTGDLIYTARVDGQWAVPAVVAAGASQPSMVVDLENTLHALFRRDVYIYYSSKPHSATWSSATMVSYGDATPDLSVDRYGTLHGVWVLTRNIVYSSKPSGSNWGASETLDTCWSVSEPQIAARLGLVQVAYRCRDPERYLGQIRTTQSVETGQWSEPLTITSMDHDSLNPSLTAEADGRPHLVWFQRNYSLEDPDIHLGVIWYRGPEPANRAGTASMTQQMTLPITMTTPTLSFYHRLGGLSGGDGAGFEVHLRTQSSSTTLLSTPADTEDWDFRSFDLSAWAGRTVTLTFQVSQTAGTPPTWAAVDDVAIGSAHPDVWVSISNATVRPGGIATYELRYGNQGGAAADGVSAFLELPAGFTFLSASVPPDEASPRLRWNLDSLGARSEATSILIEAIASPDIGVPSLHTHTASIETASDELETGNNVWQGATRVPLYDTFLPLIRR